MGRRRQEHEEPRSWAEARDSIWRLVFGPLIWAAHFVLVYGGTSVACFKLYRYDWSFAFLRASIGALTLMALIGIGIVAWRSWKRWEFLDDYDWEQDDPIEEDRHQFLGHAAFLLAGVSAIGVIYVAMPPIWVGSCA